MSQPQMQQRSAVTNGSTRRRADRDISNRPENFQFDCQNFRSAQATKVGAEGPVHPGHQHANLGGSDHTEHGALKISGERVDTIRSGGHGPLNERLIFLTACLIGQPVEVQVKNGSVYSGVFHTANAEKDYGVVLKMARLVKDSLSKGGRADVSKDATKRPVKTFIIHAKDLVQIVAKDVSLSGDGSQNGRTRENRAEMVTDSFLSQGRLGELERELKPWTPDKDDPKDLGLESTFQSTWNRSWDQFEINKTLFGVESTFDEELYTTKLERGPQMRELEREAWRIAREIEGLSTKNLHLAEERGRKPSIDLDLLDEESRFSSVLRDSEALDIGEDNEDASIDMHKKDSRNSLEDMKPDAVSLAENEHWPEKRTSRPSSSDTNEDNNRRSKRDSSPPGEQDYSGVAVDGYAVPVSRQVDTHKERVRHGAGSDSSSKRTIKAGGLPSPLLSPSIGDTTSIQALNLDPGLPQVTEDVYREFNEFRQQENAKRGKKQREEQVNELKSFSESLKDLTKDLEPRFQKLSSKNVSGEGGTKQLELKPTTSGGSLMTNTLYPPPASTLPVPMSITGSSMQFGSDTMTSTSVQLMGMVLDSSRAIASLEAGTASTVPILEVLSTTGVQPPGQSIDMPISPLHSNTSTTAPSSPSSSSGVSTGSILAKKSSLNPNAKEFKLNPNAKSFMPSFNPVRPASPVVQGPVYVPSGMQPVSPVQALPVGIGQSTAKFNPYGSMAIPGASNGGPFLQSPPGGAYTPGVATASVPPAAIPGQTPLKMQPLQQPAVGHTFSSQQPIRFSGQAPPVQSQPAYLHSNGQLYSQQMMFGQPGQVVYIQPYPQVPPMPPSQPVQGASQQQQPKHRGMQGMQFCMAPPFVAGQQHFIPQVQMSQLHSSSPPTPGVLTPPMPGLQPPQGIVQAAQSTTGTMSASANAIRAGKVAGGPFQQ